MRPFLLAVASVLSPVMLAQTRVSEVEPNNTPGTAQAIRVGDQIDCDLAAGEQDWFAFTLAAAGRVRIHTSSDLYTGADTRIALLDGTGTIYNAIDDDARLPAGNLASEIQLNLSAGSYMVQVVGFHLTSSGPYSLEVGSIAPVVYDGFEVEPNDTHLTATPTGVLGVGARRFHGTLSPNTVVGTGTVDAPAIPPVVFSGVCAAPTIMFSSSVAAAPATTTHVTQTNTPLSQPAANPLLPEYVPGMNIAMTSGVNAGLARLIQTNTAFSITSDQFPAPSSPGDTLDIVTANSTTVTWVGSLPLGSLYSANGGYSLLMTSGVNAGLSRPILRNTGPSPFGSAITTNSFPAPNAQGDTFDIVCPGSTQVLRVLGGLIPNVLNPTTGFASLGSLGHYAVRFTSGANNGLSRPIVGNTGASITLANVLPAAAAANDTFQIEQVDTDYYQVVLTAPNTGFWLQINEGDDNFVFGHRYALYDAAGNALLPASSLQLPAFGTQNATCSFVISRTSSQRIWPAGTYYIAVRSPPTPFAAWSTMPGGVVPLGNYMLEVFTMPMDTGGTITEAEPPGTQANNTVATAEPFTPGQVIRGNVTRNSPGSPDPNDWFGPIVILVPSAITYQTRRNAASSPASQMLDSMVNLRDSTGAVVVTAGGGNVLDAPVRGINAVGLHGRTVVTLHLTPGNYYIEVISPGTTAFPSDQQFGDYELETSVLMPAPYVAAGYATFASNALCGPAPQPVLTRQFTSEVPATGTLFTRQLTGVTPSLFGVHVMGFANIAPFDLAIPYGGTPNVCFLNVSPDMASAVFPDGAGNAELRVFIPGSTALRGTVLWEQVLDLDLSAPNGLRLQPGNYGRLLIGERTY